MLLTWEGAQVGVEALRLEHDQEGSPAQEDGGEEEVLHDSRAGHPPATPVGCGESGSHDGGRQQAGGLFFTRRVFQSVGTQGAFLSPFFLPFLSRQSLLPPPVAPAIPPVPPRRSLKKNMPQGRKGTQRSPSRSYKSPSRWSSSLCLNVPSKAESPLPKQPGPFLDLSARKFVLASTESYCPAA